MSFIIRNLGWVLLIIFFTFMLYLISNQNNTKNINTNNWSIIENISKTGAKNKIDNNKLIVEKYNLDKYSLSETGTIEIENTEVKADKKEVSFLQWVKDFFTTDKKSEENKYDDKIVTMEDNLSPDNIEKSIEIITSKKNTNSGASSEIETKKEIIKSIIKEIKIIKNTEKELTVKEKIKKKIIEKNKNRVHTVWVKSIFLNNAYFTKRIATAYKWDNLEQLTNTNKYGCFKTEVLKAKNEKIEWLKAWTCIYYMEWFLGTRKNYKVASKIYNRNVMKKIRTSIQVSNKIKSRNNSKKVFRAEDWNIIIQKDPNRVYKWEIYNTEVWSKYLIRVNSLKLNDKSFTTKKAFLEKCTSSNCDILEQLTPVDKNGCFKINVYKSNTNKNKRGYVCQKYLR